MPINVILDKLYFSRITRWSFPNRTISCMWKILPAALISYPANQKWCLELQKKSFIYLQNVEICPCALRRPVSFQLRNQVLDGTSLAADSVMLLWRCWRKHELWWDLLTVSSARKETSCDGFSCPVDSSSHWLRISTLLTKLSEDNGSL